MEKPPVLNGWDALKRVTDGVIPYKDKTEVPVKKLLEAQRDADVEWYGDKCNWNWAAERWKVEQVRTEVAREIHSKMLSIIVGRNKLIGDLLELSSLSRSDFEKGLAMRKKNWETDKPILAEIQEVLHPLSKGD